MATGADYRYRHRQGKPMNAATWLMNWYWDQLMELIVEQARVYRTYMEVLHLLQPSIALLQPYILGQVMRHRFNSAFSRIRVKLAR